MEQVIVSYWDYDCGCNYYWYSVEEMYYYWDPDCGCHRRSPNPPGPKPDPGSAQSKASSATKDPGSSQKSGSDKSQVAKVSTK
ncbi:MAG: hypothetical protein JOZ19_04255 [Rubrobacter sp.]|nr:hypothetical protein [Rubrobacter sp.]